MAKASDSWHLCDDCLDPLAKDLGTIAADYHRPADHAKHRDLSNEARAIHASARYVPENLTDEQRQRLEAISQQLAKLRLPLEALDLDILFRKYQVERGIEWLKVNVGVDYANEFKQKLYTPWKRLAKLNFTASQILNGDVGKKQTIGIHYAPQFLIDLHYEELKKLFPNHESYPEPEEMPPDFQRVHFEVYEEDTIVFNELLEAVQYLRLSSSTLRRKFDESMRPIEITSFTTKGHPLESPQPIRVTAFKASQSEAAPLDPNRPVRWLETPFAPMTRESAKVKNVTPGMFPTIELPSIVIGADDLARLEAFAPGMDKHQPDWEVIRGMLKIRGAVVDEKTTVKEFLGMLRRNVDTPIGSSDNSAENQSLKSKQMPTGFLGIAELKKVLGIPEENHAKFDVQVSRKRNAWPSSVWQTVENPGVRGSTFQYRVDSIEIQELAANYLPKPE